MSIDNKSSTPEFSYIDTNAGLPSTAKKTESKSGRVRIGAVGDLSVAAKKADGRRGVLGSISHLLDTKFRCVPIKIGDAAYNLNINSIARRLHIAPTEVRKAHQEGRLTSLLAKAAKTEAEALKHYKKIIGEAKLAKIPKATALKTLRVAIETEQAIQFTAKPHFFSKKEITWLIGKTGKEYQFSKESSVLGAGSFGVVKEAKGVSQKSQSQVVKIPKTTDLESSGIKNEIEKLRLLNSEGPHRGIQGNAHLLVDLTSGKSNEIGMMTDKMDGDYEKICETPPEGSNCLDEFDQLLDGLSYMHAKGIIHGDIKPENFLQKTDNEGKVTVVISDFGGARNANDRGDWSIGLAVTAEYTLQKEAFSPDQEIEKKHDVFSMGCSFAKRLIFPNDPFKKYTFDKKGHKWPDPKSGLNPLPANTPPALVKLIESMLDADHKKRPTAAEAKERLAEIIAREKSLGFAANGRAAKKNLEEKTIGYEVCRSETEAGKLDVYFKDETGKIKGPSTMAFDPTKKLDEQVRSHFKAGIEKKQDEGLDQREWIQLDGYVANKSKADIELANVDNGYRLYYNEYTESILLLKKGGMSEEIKIKKQENESYEEAIQRVLEEHNYNPT